MEDERFNLLKIMNTQKKEFLDQMDGLENIRKFLLLIDLTEIYSLVTKYGNIDVLQAETMLHPIKGRKHLSYKKTIMEESELIEKSMKDETLKETEVNRIILMIELSHIYDAMIKNDKMSFEEAYFETKKDLFNNDGENLEVDSDDDIIQNFTKDNDEIIHKDDTEIKKCIISDELRNHMDKYMDELNDMRRKLHIKICD
jgi:hypothetical protein